MDIKITVELDPASRRELGRIMRQNKEPAPAKLTDAELSDLFAYCARLARMVSPRDAKRYFGFTFDGAVGDTLDGLAMLYGGGLSELFESEFGKTAADFKNDGLYGPTFRQMMDDIHRLLDGKAMIE